MARTAAGAQITEQHRRAQLAIQAQVIRDFARLWPLWEGDSTSFGQLVAATVPLVKLHHQNSSAVATAYYAAFRKAEKVAGAATPQAAPPVNEEQVVSSLYATGEAMTRKAIAAGYSPQAAMQGAVARTSGAVSRHVLNGGRDAITRSIEADGRVEAYIRITDGDPCAFCAMLAGRGGVYLTEDTASFESHDACGCTAEPFYEGSGMPERNRAFHDLYNRATREARESSDLNRGTSNDLLNAFRRAYDGQRPGASPSVPPVTPHPRPGALSEQTERMSDAAVE